MNKKDLVVITCPVCGHQYMPGEVYMPNSFFGKQSEVTRTPSGEIDFYMGDDMDFDEEFICDGCGAKLNIHANLSFSVEANQEEDFDAEYVTEISKAPKIKLSEEELF